MANETTTKTVASGTHLNAAGTVKTVIGLVKAIDVNGNERVLQTGDHVYPGETIQTAGDGAVLVEFPNGGHLDLPHSSHIVLDADIYAPTDSAEKQAEDEATRIERAIAEGRDPSIETDAAAAGGTGGDEGSSTPLVLNFNNTQGAVDSGFQTAPLSNSFNSAQQDQQPTIPEAAPSITAATPGGTVLELANTTGSSAQDAASGTISFTDINPADVHTVSVKAEGTNYLGTFTPTLVADSTQTANGAGTVGWTFNVQDGALDFLAAGQTLTQKYDVTISDGQGGTATQVVTITITGTNDAPVFVGSSEEQSDLPPNSALVSEQVNVTGEESADSASGQLRFVDVDLTDAHTISDVKSQGENYLGTFTPVITADSTGGGVGVVSWTYSVPDSALDFLAAGQVLTQKYDVTINDGNGGTATETVTITIVGTNDAPVITSSANDAVGAVKEDTTTSASGQLTASDVDNGATQTWSINEAEGGPSAAGQYGSLTVDAQTGAWTYTLNNDAQNVQSLAAGESHDETFTVRVTDDQGATAEQVVTITVTGTNDAPVITSSANDAVGAVKEDTTTSASGQLTASDVDNGATQTWSINEAEGGPSAAGQYGSLTVDAQTGAWTYTLNNDAKNVQSLAAGESHDETFTVRVTDDQGATAEQVVTITLTGTNDAPVITSNAAAAQGSVTEAGNLDDGSAVAGVATATGTLTSSDVDNGATATWSIDGKSSYGSIAIDAATGKWTYTLDNTLEATQGLKEGDVKTETFTATVTDEFGATATQVVTITINGTNDAPVAIAANAQGKEDASGISIQLSGSDVDGTVASFTIGSLPTHGTLYFGANEVHVGDSIPATSNGATLTFVPTHDWSGDTSFSYNAVDNNGAVSVSSATANISVLPVADTPVVTIDIGQVTHLTQTIDVSNVTSTDSGFKVAAFDINGNPATVSIHNDAAHNVVGFGVSGNVAGNNGAADEIGSNGSQSEKVVVTFDAAANDVKVSFSWLNSKETAHYVVKDAAGNVISSGDVKGVTDQVDQTFGVEGKLIKSIEFTAGSQATDDYLVNHVTFTTGSTYAVTLDVKPTDIDYSEKVTSVKVEAPEGAVLSAGTIGSTVNGVTTWELPLTDNGNYHVTTDPATGEVHVTGLTVTVPTALDNTPFEVKVVGTVQDGPVDGVTDTTSATASAIAPIDHAPVGMPDSYAAVDGSKTSFTSVLSNDTDQDGDKLMVTVVSSNGNGPGLNVDGIHSITTTLGGTVTMNADGTFSYQAPVVNNTNGQSQPDSFYYKAGDGTLASDWTKVTINVGDTAPVAHIDVAKAGVAGNVLANDDKSLDGAITVSSVNGTSVSSSGTIIHGTYGDLAIKTDGSYSYIQNPVTITSDGNTQTHEAGATMYATTNWKALNSGTISTDGMTAWNGVSELSGSKAGYGVKSGGAQTIDGNEALVINLDHSASSVTIQLGQLNANQSSLAKWYAYDDGGHLVSSGDFHSSFNNGVLQPMTVTNAGGFKYLVLANEGTSSENGFDVTKITYQPHGIDEFSYSITDGDGSTSSSSLLVTTDQLLQGDSSANTLTGGAGNDILVGGSGNDILSGGAGSDVFVWKSGETGSDTVTDFTAGTNGDVLNLADLLHGEHANADSLNNYLTFGTSSNANGTVNTVISIHADGAGSAVTQTITLQGVDLVTGHDSTSIINNLLGHGNLKTDA